MLPACRPKGNPNFFPLGHALLIGNTTLILQHQWVAAKVHTHGHFYDRLVEECAWGEGDP